LVSGAAVLAAVAAVIVGATRLSAPSALPARASFPEPALAPSSGPPADAEAQDAPAPRDGRLDGGEWGTVQLPPHASGHRIFVDGRRFKTDGVAPLHLPCGPHVIQVGSSGTPQTIDLPCGGEVQLQ
jgi:hypothetical protein